MTGRRLAILILLCVCALSVADNAFAQSVKSKYDKSADFKKYKKYAWGSNYLLTQQRPEEQGRINAAIVDSMNRYLQAKGFVQDQKSPHFKIHFDAGGMPNADVGAQPDLFAAGDLSWAWNGGGISSDVWVYSLAKVRITVADAATNATMWQALATKKIREPDKFGNNLKQNVDDFIGKTLKDFPPKK
jgi:hypothetical protein